MVTRSVRVAKKGKGKGKVSVKALLLSAVNSIRVHLFQGERGPFWTFVPDTSQKKASHA